MTQRTFVYIDGFNLYFRGLKNSPYKWLDLKKLCQTILNETNKIESIKYFAESINLVKKLPNKIVGLILPPNCNPSGKLLSLVDFIKTIRPNMLSISQLPYNIPGTDLNKPAKWENEIQKIASSS